MAYWKFNTCLLRYTPIFFVPSSTKVQVVAVTLTLMWAGAWESHFKDCFTHLFHGFRNRHFNKISLDNMLYFHY